MDGDSDRQYDSGSETLFDKFEYTYTLDGSRASETRTNADGTTTIEWTYDGLNRLISEEFSGFDGQGDALGYVDTYSFDLSSNRMALVHDDSTSGGPGSAGPDATTTYEYDANDRLLAETRDVAGSSSADRYTEYGYSPTDQTAKTVYEGLDDTGDVVQEVEFLYDATGRMTGVTMTVGSATTTVSYKYDHNGFRVEATVDDGTNPPVTTIFHVDPANPTGYAQVVEQGVDGDSDGRLDASEIEKAFIIGLDPITQATASALGHFLSDAHGSTKAVLNAATSSVVERYVYSAYGQDLGLDSSPATNFRYAGEYIDPITGLSFNRARWYDRSNGRWNRLDPFAGRMHNPLSFHKYLYGAAEPVMSLDPSGTTSYIDILAATGIRSYLTSLYFPVFDSALQTAVGVAGAMNADQILGQFILSQFGLDLFIAIGNGIEYVVDWGDDTSDANTSDLAALMSFSRGRIAGTGTQLFGGFSRLGAIGRRVEQLTAQLYLAGINARDALTHLPDDQARLYGTRVHTRWGGSIRALSDRGLGDGLRFGIEDSFALPPGHASGKGNVRLDAVLYQDGRIVAVYDLKTQNAALSRSRVREIRDALQEYANKVNPNLPSDQQVDWRHLPIIGLLV